MSYETLKFEKEESLATITFNRPESLNAFNLKQGKELSDALEICANDTEIRAVIITGAGRAFHAGGDINSMKEQLEKDPENPQLIFKTLLSYAHNVVSAIRRLEKPVIAMVNGVAAGIGFSFAIACDIVFASEKAKFTQAYVKLGLTPDGASTFFLPRLVGPLKANELIFSGDIISADEALKLGLINRIFPENELESVTKEFAKRLANGPTFAIGKAKQLVNRSLMENLETQMENEEQVIIACSRTEDFKEGVAAFFEKRKPNFKGK